MKKHKHVFTKCQCCDVCGKPLLQLVEEGENLREFADTDTAGKPTARDWDKT